MSHRYLGWVGAVLLLSLSASTACGARDTLYVLDDFGGSGGASAFAGDSNLGGLAGKFGNAGSGFGGAGVAGTSFGTAGFGGSSHAFGGSTGFGGGVSAFGGTAGFSGGHFGGFGGSAVGGEAGAIETAGTSGFSCAQCLAQTGNPCFIPICNFTNNTCQVDLLPDGTACSASTNLCQPNNVCMSGKCVVQATLACPPSTSQCTQSACDPASGKCINQPLSGTVCDDGDPCTTSRCVNGMCVAQSRTAVCQSNDKCCPAGCTSTNDNDCAGAPRQITLNASDRGWYDNSGFHDSRIKNTFTGIAPPTYYNSFFIFDLSAVSGTIISAQLLLTEENFYGSSKQMVTIWDVSETSGTLSMTNQAPLIYQDLQSGNQYGSFVGTAQDIGNTLSATLNAKAVTDLNAARGSTFSIGLHDSTLSGQTAENEGIRFSEGNEQLTDQLILTVQ
ncbi:MAG TPA: hypothetical protein VK745_26490 [Polyangiaceae bacterium]|nr:hypothetical protein [Polyangiaceae bacterium]